jgi:hypothetical protein
MEVFIVLIEDRHCDIGCEVFSTEESAILYAKGIAKEYARHIDDIKEKLTPAMKLAGWLYYAQFSEEDCVRVERKEIDAKRN